MKIFLSQPMTGRDDEAIIHERVIYTKKYEDNGDEVIDSIIDLGDADPIEYLGESVKLMASADKVVMLPGWRSSKGCRVEHQVAIEYEKEIEYV